MTVFRIILAQQAMSNYAFWVISVQIRARFGLISELIFGLKTGPLRGPVLSENTRNYNGFRTGGVPKSAPFWCPFRVPFGLHFDSLFGPPVLGSAGQLKSSFFLVLILAQGRRLEDFLGQAIN